MAHRFFRWHRTHGYAPRGCLRRAAGGLILAAVSAVAATWTGLGPDEYASSAANWDAPPGNGDAVVLDGTSAKNMTWDLAVAPASWTQTAAYTGTVTIGTRYGDIGLTNLAITGDCAVHGGRWTHLANPAGEEMIYRLRVSVGGHLTLGAAAGIDVDAKGFGIKNGPGKFKDQSGASHGGRGGVYGTTKVPSPCYGSAVRPYHLGSGGAGSPYGIQGGGAVWLEVGGTLTLDGEIRANSPDGYEWYTGSGGSVCCIAGALQGSGAVRANGGAVTKGGAGGGGRIAMVVTNAGADFAAWSGTAEAQGCTTSYDSCPGTIYLERGADGFGKGELVVLGQGAPPPTYTFGTELGAWEPETNAFSRLTLANSGVRLVVHPGSLLDLSRCRIDGSAGGINEIAIVGGGMINLGDNPVWSNATLRLDAPSSTLLFGGETLTIGSNGTVRIDQPRTFSGDLVVTSGGRLAHTPIGAVEQYRLDLEVTGDLTIAPGGAVSVTGCGFANGYGPGKSIASGYGASHGGHGAANVAANLGNGAYGSIHTPTNAGSGGASSPYYSRSGGGIVRLRVSGILHNDGVVDADAFDWDYYTGAGGSLWITAGAVEGIGVFRANGGAVTGYTPGAGGRIALTVTNAGATIGAFQGAFEARGGALGSSYRDRIAGAGTIYLRNADQAWNEGTLLIDNDGMASTTRWTPIVPEVAGRDFGAVVLRDGATLRLAENERVAVSGGWSNTNGLLLAENGSEVALVGGGTVAIDGTSTFHRLTCEVPGMNVAFGADSFTRIASNGFFLIRGSSGAPVTLAPAAAGAIWRLAVDSNAVQNVDYAAVSNSDASDGIVVVAKDSADLGGNLNWRFTTIVPGEEIVWTGESDSQWANPENWDLGRVPVATDRVRIPAAGPNTPVLNGAAILNRLEVAAGGALALGGNDLTVTNDLVVAGALTASATETVTLLGDASFAGAVFSAARSRLLVAGDRSRVIDFGGADFHGIRVTQGGGALIVGGGLAADEWRMEIPPGASLDCAFAAGRTVCARRFLVLGDAAATNATLRSTVPDSAWGLQATEYARVTGAAVGDSDAAAGITVPAFAAGDAGGNANWDFAAKGGVWTGGGASGDFHDPANWAAGVVPGADAHVVLDTAAAVTITNPVTLRSLTVGGGAADVACTSDAPLTVTESLLLLDRGTLTLNKPSAVGNAFYLGEGGLLTHAGNTDSEANKIDLTVGGDMMIEQGGAIDVRRKGYGKKMGPGAMTINGYAPSHGGKGKNNNANEGQLCYGSIISPTNLSSGSYWDVGSGAVRLTAGGTFAHYGEITADGLGGYGGVTLPDYYSGAGGSIWITAGNLIGDGAIRANGGDYLIDLPGGGGRIALVLSQATGFSGFSGSVEARGGKNVSSLTERVPASGAGTIFRRTANERRDMGTVTVDNDGGLNTTIACTDIPSASHGDPAEFRRLTFAITDGATLRLRDDCTVGDVQILGTTGRLNLNGYSLTIHSKEHPFPANTVINYGEVIWAPIPTGTLLTLR